MKRLIFFFVFDRGLQDRDTYDELKKRNIHFIARLQFQYRMDVIKEIPLNEGSNIKKQLIGYLYRTGHNNKTKHTYRVIHVNPDPKTDTHKDDSIKKGQAM